ncbi:MAG: hypothetical protein Fur0028_12990 [Bacteroidales bacterium]
MKKLFFVILASGIMMTACKKEDLKKETDQNKQETTFNKTVPLLPPNYFVALSNVLIDGGVYDKVMNSVSGDTYYREIIPAEDDVYARWKDAYVVNSQMRCEGTSARECRWKEVDGEWVLIVRHNAVIENHN